MAKSSEDVLLQVPFVKHKKDDGTLYLMTERLAWIQGNRDTVTMSHRYADIKSQKISSEGKVKIQLQIVLHNNASFTFHFVHPDGPKVQVEWRNQVKELLLQLLPKFRRKIDRELEEKSRVLRDNPALFQLYKDLVTEGIVTAEEFWSNHCHLTGGSQKPVDTQEVGVASGFLSGIQPQTDGNGLTYNLTTDVIESIFKTYPAVRRKHGESVPSQMNEAQFWTKFFQSHYFHRDRMPVSKDLFSDCAKADDKEIKRELEKLKNSDIISVLDDSEKQDDSEIAPKDSLSGLSVHRTMIKRFNQFSIMVLKACERNKNEEQESSGKKDVQSIQAGGANENKISSNGVDYEAKKAKIDTSIEFEDLMDTPKENFKKLNLTEVDRFLNGPVADYHTDTVTSEQIIQTVHALKVNSDRWSTKPQLMDAKTAGQILAECSPGGSLMKTSHSEISTQSLPPEIETELRNMYVSLSELLRHFWSCFPLTTPAREEKATKTHETLKKFEQIKIQHFRDRLLRDHLNSVPILAHINAMLSAAYEKYAIWIQRTRK